MAKYFSKLVHSRWAIRKDEADLLASSSVNGDLRRPDGEFNVESNITMRDGIAIIHVDGALTYRSDFWAAILGGDTYNSIEAAFDRCMADPLVNGIIFDIDSPGGEVSGVSDLAEKIYNARGKKPNGIVSRTGGLMCSAAYWIGCACERVYSADNGILGSIGVLCTFMKESDSGLQTVVSDLSPAKAPNPEDPVGMGQIKKELNDLAAVFVGAVAKQRGVDFDRVLNGFGKGGVFVGKSAVDAGLADGVKSLDAIVSEMSSKQQTSGGFMTEDKKPAAVEEANTVSAEERKAAILAEERSRVKAISEIFAGLDIGAEDSEKFIAEGKSVTEAKNFAFEKIRRMLAAAKTELSEKEKEIKSLRAEKSQAANNEQAEAVRKLLAAENAATAAVEGGASAVAEDPRKAAFIAGFTKVFEKTNKGGR